MHVTFVVSSFDIGVCLGTLGIMSREGQVLERKYRLERLLGEGGMGQVYEAVHEVLGRRVAIKFLLPELADNEQVLARFFQEAKIAGSLGHPNICEVTDVGTAEDGAPYMIMPLLQGHSMREEIDQGLMSLDRIVHVMAQVLSALQRAHDAGIVHRDLKPANVFLVKDEDGRDRVKLLDFGISKVVSGQDGSVKSGLTVTGMVLGTPYYMAPEQARGQRDIDHRADIYSAGAMLFELLTGRVPFEGDNYNEVIVKIVTQVAPTVTQITGRVPPELESVVARSLDPDREKRFQTARDFRTALLAAAQASGLLGVPREGEDWSDVYSLPAGSPPPRRASTKVGSPLATRPGVAQPGGSRTGMIVGAVVGGIAMLAVAAALLLWHPWSRNGKRAERDPGTRVASRGGAPGSRPAGDGGLVRKDAQAARTARDAQVVHKPRKPQKKVKLTLEVFPKGAKVTLNGKPVTDSRIELPRSNEPMVLRLEAKGYVSTTRTVIPSMDTKIKIRLKSKRGRHVSRAGARNRARGGRGKGEIKGRNETNVETSY